MSEHAVTIVGLDVVEPEACAVKLRTWLLATGVAAPNDRRDPLWQPSELKPGPAWRTVVEWEDPGFEDLANNGIDIVTERVVHDPGGNFEPTSCPSCRTRMDDERYLALVEPWLEEGEPTATCTACGHAALIGDWDAPWGLAVGAPAVCFNNWPILTAGFEGAVRQQIGGRTVVVRAHI